MFTKKTARLILATLILPLLIAACGIKEDEPVQPDVNYVPLTDEELGVSLVHPEGWVSSSGFGGLTVASSQEVIDGDSLAEIGDNGFALIIPGELDIFNKQMGQTFTEADALPILNVYKQLLEREGQTHQEIEPPQEVTIEGQPAAMMWTRSQEEGKNLIIVLAVIINDDYMALVSAASLEPASEEMRPIFEHIINSIQIASPN
ncbi:MAG: hypothetical protein GY803_11235 [Chloroflexi bacterium]|nr:hypothetical protein [Chloroflexota bacterium]